MIVLLTGHHHLLFFSDRHKSFKLRLPSIRRDISRDYTKNRATNRLHDPEDPPEGEESVPLHRLSPPAEVVPQDTPPLERRMLDREFSDVSTWSNEEFKSRKSSQGSIRRASSMEHLDHSSAKTPANTTAAGKTGYMRKAATLSAGSVPVCDWILTH